MSVQKSTDLDPHHCSILFSIQYTPFIRSHQDPLFSQDIGSGSYFGAVIGILSPDVLCHTVVWIQFWPKKRIRGSVPGKICYP